MIGKRTVGSVILGSAVGVAQGIGLRELDNYVASDFLTKKQSGGSPTPPLLMKQLGNFGSFSVLVGGGVSAFEIGFGLYGAMSHKSGYFQNHPNTSLALISAGTVGLGFAFSAMAFPAVQWDNAVAVDPNRPLGGNFNRPGANITGQSRAAKLGAAAVS